MKQQYDCNNCQSLFGYARDVHKRSGGVCQLCKAGRGEKSNFALWRQLTVEHIVGRSQGGYRKEIRSAIDKRFPDFTSERKKDLTSRIDEANTITACSFCNSTTSRDRSYEMRQLITEAKGTSDDEVIEQIEQKLGEVLEKKQRCVSWKLLSIERRYNEEIKRELDEHPDRRKKI